MVQELEQGQVGGTRAAMTLGRGWLYEVDMRLLYHPASIIVGTNVHCKLETNFKSSTKFIEMSRKSIALGIVVVFIKCIYVY